MSFEDRLQTASYVSPGGTTILFDYTLLTQTVERRTTAYEFPDVDATYIQDLGSSSRRFSWRIYLAGEDYDLAADEFDEALKERGPGILNHPQRGAIRVVPFGEITRRDDLVAAAGQAVYEISFFETTGLEFLPIDEAPTYTGEDYRQQAAADFEDYTELDTATQQAQEKNEFLQLVNTVEETLKPIAETVQNVRRSFDRVLTSILTGADVLLGAPATLAAQVQQLIAIPAEAAQLLENKINGYLNLIDTVLSGGPPKDANDLQLRALFSGAALSAAVASATTDTYTTRGQAVETAAVLLEYFDAIGAWRDLRPSTVDDIGSDYAELLEQTAAGAAEILRGSFNLAQERAVILDRDKTIVELTYQFYQTEEKLDQLINTNQLTGSEILLVPRGRRLVYYV